MLQRRFQRVAIAEALAEREAARTTNRAEEEHNVNASGRNGVGRSAFAKGLDRPSLPTEAERPRKVLLEAVQ